VKQSVSFFGVTNMEASLKFCVDGLGFQMKHWWIPNRVEEGSDPTGEFAVAGCSAVKPPSCSRSLAGTTTDRDAWDRSTRCFMCEDALALYREFKSRGV